MSVPDLDGRVALDMEPDLELHHAAGKLLRRRHGLLEGLGQGHGQARAAAQKLERGLAHPGVLAEKRGGLGFILEKRS